jgi:hypothetical protein
MTLIEVVVVMTGVATMLGLCAVTIQVLMRLNTDSQARLSAATNLDRLASQFREDVHDCDGARLGGKAGEAAASLRLTLGPGRVITYAAREGRVDRTESGSGPTSRHESYALVHGSVVRFADRDEGPRRYVAMVVTPRAEKEPIDRLRSWEVLALRGKDRLGPLRPEGKGAR